MYFVIIIAALVIVGNGPNQIRAAATVRQWFTSSVQIPITAYVLDLKAEDTEILETRHDYNDKNGRSNKIFPKHYSSSSIVRPNFNLRFTRNVAADMHQQQRLLNSNNPTVKAKLRYHHEQRHSNGSVSGSYAQIEPTGKLRVVHYVSDDKGYREYPEEQFENNIGQHSNNMLSMNQPSFSTVSKTADNRPGQQMQQLLSSSDDHSTSTNNNKRGIFGPLETYNPQSPIVQSAIVSVQPYAEKSPLYEKYYRPSPDEVQKAYNYHRLRSSQDLNAFRPQDPTQINLPPVTGRPEVVSVYGEYQSPIIQYQDSYPNGYYVYSTPPPGLAPGQPFPAEPGPSQQYAAPPIMYNQPAEAYPPANENPRYMAGQIFVQNPYPQTLPPQSPIYVSTSNNSPPPNNNFVPASTYSGPVAPNTATFNQPYPTNIPIYGQLVPQNVPTFAQRPPDNVPVVYQPPPIGIGPQQPIPPGLPANVLTYAGVNPNNLVSAS